MGYRWCLDDEEPEYNGPDCGHADGCPYFKALTEEDSSVAEELAEYNRRKEGAK